MLDIEIVRAGNRGLRPGVVAMEYIDCLSAWAWILGIQSRLLLLHCMIVLRDDDNEE